MPPRVITDSDQAQVAVQDLFLGALIPGLILGAAYVLWLLLVGALRPQAMPLAPTVLGGSSAIAVGGLVYAAALALLYPEAARKVLEILRGFAGIARG